MVTWIKCPANHILYPAQDARRFHCPFPWGFQDFLQAQRIPPTTLWSLSWFEVSQGKEPQPFPCGLVTHTTQSLCAWRMCLDFSLMLNLHMMASAGNAFHHPQLAGSHFWPGWARCVSAPWHYRNVTALSMARAAPEECQQAQPRRNASHWQCESFMLPSQGLSNKVQGLNGRHTAQPLSLGLQDGLQQRTTLQAKMNSPLKDKACLCRRAKASQVSSGKYRSVFPGWQLQSSLPQGA